MITVTNSTDAMHVLHSEGIDTVRIVDETTIHVSESDRLDSLDILADEELLPKPEWMKRER